MKWISLFIAVALVLPLSSAQSQTIEKTMTILSMEGSQIIESFYDAFGNTTGGYSKSTVKRKTADGKGGEKTDVDISESFSTWKGGSSKVDKVKVNSTSNSTDGSKSSRNYTDTYSYSNAGKLTGASGSGSFSSTDGETGNSQSGSISRSFDIRDGEALNTKTVMSGTSRNKDGSDQGSFTNTQTNTYEYKGMGWNVTSTKSVATENWKSGSSSSVTTTTNTPRNQYGVVTGISQSMSGTRTTVNAVNGGVQAKQTYNLSSYSPSYAFDSKFGGGWYVSYDKQIWNLAQ